MKKILIAIILVFIMITPAMAEEIPAEWQFSITLKHDFHEITLNLRKHPEFFTTYTKYYLNNEEIVLPRVNFCVESDEEEVIPDNVEVREEFGIDIAAISKYLGDEVAGRWDHDSQDVRIYKDENGKVAFEGVGIFGEKVNIPASARIIEKAIHENLGYVTLAIDRTDPVITVDDEELREMGIQDLLSIGESDFSGSPYNRIHNITVGANRFNGVIIPQGETFSFNNILQEVSARMGYKKELVIKGDRTIPDYGGGLCQVSSTTFRAALLSGVEIVERWPHAYAVTYYTPWGSDATIYLGGKDLKFKNDTPGAMLIQTRIEGKLLFFHFYGTRDDRYVAMYGPYTGNWKSALPKKVEYTNEIPVGTTQIVSGSHSGFDATWFRMIMNGDKRLVKRFFSRFEPRGLFYLIGADTASEESDGAVADADNKESYLGPI